jgi:hypothetical protein
VQLAAEYRVEALGADPAGNWEQVVVKVAASTVQRYTGWQADSQFKGKMAASLGLSSR